MEVVKVMEGHRSLELEEFMSGVGDQLDETKETLGQWFTQIQTIFYKVMTRLGRIAEGFFLCVFTFIYN